MTLSEQLDSLLGTHKTIQEMHTLISDTERRLLRKLVSDFHIDSVWEEEIVKALYRFKKIYILYCDLWIYGRKDLSYSNREDAEQIFGQILINLRRDSRSCFSMNNFFGYIRYALHAVQRLGLPSSRQKVYLKWILNFPVIPADSLKEVMENEIWRSNLPHVYMHMTAGFIREKLTQRMDPRKIPPAYRTFLTELNIGRSHTRWFNKRYAGSYGSRQ